MTTPISYANAGQVFLNDLTFLNKTPAAMGGSGKIEVAGKRYDVSLSNTGIQVAPENSWRNFFSLSASRTASGIQADLQDQMQTWQRMQHPPSHENLQIFQSAKNTLRTQPHTNIQHSNHRASSVVHTERIRHAGILAPVQKAKAARVLGLESQLPIVAAYGDAGQRGIGVSHWQTPGHPSAKRPPLQFATIDAQNALVGIRWEDFGISGLVRDEQHGPQAHQDTLLTMMRNIRQGTLRHNPALAKFEFDNNTYTAQRSQAWLQLLQQNADKLDIIGRIRSFKNAPALIQAGASSSWLQFANSHGPHEAVKALVRKNLHISQQHDLAALYLSKEPPASSADATQCLEHCVDHLAKALMQFEEGLSKGLSPGAAHAEALKEFPDTFTEKEKMELSLVLDDVVRCAVFRQTSKLGLEFYRQQSIPVVFQWRNHQGIENSAQVSGPGGSSMNWWFHGFTSGVSQMMPITLSEQRKVQKMEAASVAGATDNLVVLKT